MVIKKKKKRKNQSQRKINERKRKSRYQAVKKKMNKKLWRKKLKRLKSMIRGRDNNRNLIKTYSKGLKKRKLMRRRSKLPKNRIKRKK